MEQRNLQGRVALITGGGSGIGEATAGRLARAGASVMIVDINLEAAQTVAQALTDEGLSVRAVAADISRDADIRLAVDATIEAFGRIDILHNNAANGSADVWGQDKTVLDMDIDVWDKTFDTNVRAPMLFCKYVVPHMIAQGQGGSIINMSSGASQIGQADAMTAYGSSKGALNSLTLYLAEQLGVHKIRCNALVCGVVITKGLIRLFPKEAIDALESRTAMREGSRPEDIAAFVHFLASDDSRVLTGKLFNT